MIQVDETKYKKYITRFTFITDRHSYLLSILLLLCE
jgi:hypothetical protein